MHELLKRAAGFLGRIKPPKGWRFRLWWPEEWWRKGALIALYILVPPMTLDLLLPPPIQRGDVISGVVMDRRGAVMRIFPVEDGKWRMRAHLDEIDPDFIEALLAYEDKRFRDHGGVDFLALATDGVLINVWDARGEAARGDRRGAAHSGGSSNT